MPSPVQVLDQQLRLLQADVRILKTSIQGVDVLTRSVVELRRRVSKSGCRRYC
jgi:hypothetical protein